MYIDDCDELNRRIEELWDLKVEPPTPYMGLSLFRELPTYNPPCLPHRLLFAGWEPLEVNTEAADDETRVLTALMRMDYKWTMLRLLQADSVVRDDSEREMDGWTWFDECYRLAHRMMDRERMSPPLQNSLENIALCIYAFVLDKEVYDIEDFVSHEESFALSPTSRNIYCIMRLCARAERMLADSQGKLPSKESISLVKELEKLCSKVDKRLLPEYVEELICAIKLY